MQNALTTAIQSMHNDQTRLDGIGRNLANVSTPGYKRETVSSQPFAEALRVAGTDLPGGTTAVSLPRATSSIDTRAGSLKYTGENLEVAIEGEGYFEVAGADGPVYTRQGRFHLDARGRLVTDAGLPVMGRSGEITLSGGRPSIDRDGTVTEDGRTVGRLKVMAMPTGAAIERAGSGVMRPAGGQQAVESTATVRQGYLENSNVDSMTEMVRLIETTRHFESAQKLVQGYDEMMEKALRKLGDF